MAAAIALRDDYDAARLRELAKRSGDADQTRRLMSLAVVYAGGSRGEGAKAGGVGLQTLLSFAGAAQPSDRAAAI